MAGEAPGTASEASPPKGLREDKGRACRTLGSSPQLYHPLDSSKKEIRILLVKRSPAKSRGLIRGTFRVISLVDDNHPPYETISYAWGDAKHRAQIKLNGLTISVPASSEAALRCMRRRYAPRALWIDAVCINQDDIAERGHQVNMMGQVYKNSVGNLIYLGLGSIVMDRAIKQIRYCVREIRAETRDFKDFDNTVRKSNNDSIYSDADLSFAVDAFALISFFSLSWFQRQWVLQEVILAPSNTCYLGSHRIALLDVLRVAVWLHIYKGSATPPDLAKNNGLLCTHQIEDMMYLYRTGQHQWTSLLFRTFTFEVTDMRDKIYSLLGVLREEIAPKDLSLLIPDYTKPVAHVLANAIKYAIQIDKSLSVLGLIEWFNSAASDEDHFPSWTPQLHKPKPKLETSFYFSYDFNCCTGFDLQTDYPQISSDPGTLTLKGFTFDQVLALSAPFTWKIWEDTNAYSNWLGHVWHIFQRHSSSAGSRDGHISLARTLIAGRNDDLNLCDFADLAPWHDFIHNMRPPHEILSGADAKNVSPNELHRYNRALCNACLERRFCVTRTGRIGLVPPTAARNDIIAVLHQGQFPLVFRQGQRDELRLIGQAYVDGIMMGEAVQDHVRSGHPLETFRLR